MYVLIYLLSPVCIHDLMYFAPSLLGRLWYSWLLASAATRSDEMKRDAAATSSKEPGSTTAAKSENLVLEHTIWGEAEDTASQGIM